ncbi:hypothetical protein CLCR_06063 [Cladophialophora carrionii]|uniref:Uncharacterized protein n=1 Tax=Cladophialophora carrionii TaxID=86049 RepID=A0A1C1C872_9EURO|nr:hypothetical protein CLCR_06063 [Cladophialophora carrionii]
MPTLLELPTEIQAMIVRLVFEQYTVVPVKKSTRQSTRLRLKREATDLGNPVQALEHTSHRTDLPAPVLAPFDPFSFFHVCQTLYKNKLLKAVALMRMTVMVAEDTFVEVVNAGRQLSHRKEARLIGSMRLAYTARYPIPSPSRMTQLFPSLMKFTIEGQRSMFFSARKAASELDAAFKSAQKARRNIIVYPVEFVIHDRNIHSDQKETMEKRFALDYFLRKGCLVRFEFAPCANLLSNCSRPWKCAPAGPLPLPSAENEAAPFSRRLWLNVHVWITFISRQHDDFEKWRGKISTSGVRLELNTCCIKAEAVSKPVAFPTYIPKPSRGSNGTRKPIQHQVIRKFQRDA